MSLRLIAVLGVVSLVGCKKEDTEDTEIPAPTFTESGVWLFTLPASDAPTCTETVQNHNFTGATLPTEPDPGPLTETSTADYSPQVFFAQIVDDAAGGLVLVFEKSILPGTEGDDGWTFTWDTFSNESNTTTHEAGYTYTLGKDHHDERTMVFTFADGAITGTWTEDVTKDDTWSETDEWDDVATGIAAGEIPANKYLVDDQDHPSKNNPPRDDCDGDTCDLEVVEDCASEGTLTAVQVTDDDDFSDISNASNDGGWQ